MFELHAISNVRYVKDYVLDLTFDNGVSGRVDLKPFIGRGVFAALRDLSLFRMVSLDPEMGTISWPNGADIAPETLYDLVKKNEYAISA